MGAPTQHAADAVLPPVACANRRNRDGGSVRLHQCATRAVLPPFAGANVDLRLPRDPGRPPDASAAGPGSTRLECVWSRYADALSGAHAGNRRRWRRRCVSLPKASEVRATFAAGLGRLSGRRFVHFDRIHGVESRGAHGVNLSNNMSVTLPSADSAYRDACRARSEPPSGPAALTSVEGIGLGGRASSSRRGVPLRQAPGRAVRTTVASTSVDFGSMLARRQRAGQLALSRGAVASGHCARNAYAFLRRPYHARASCHRTPLLPPATALIQRGHWRRLHPRAPVAPPRPRAHRVWATRACATTAPSTRRAAARPTPVTMSVMLIQQALDALYTSWFRLADADQDGRVTGGEAVMFMSKSGLAPAVLSEIWDVGASGVPFLDASSFRRVMQLIWYAQVRRPPLLPSRCAGVPQGRQPGHRRAAGPFERDEGRLASEASCRRQGTHVHPQRPKRRYLPPHTAMPSTSAARQMCRPADGLEAQRKHPRRPKCPLARRRGPHLS